MKTRVHHTHHQRGLTATGRGSLTWLALGLVAVAALLAAPWALRARASVQAGPAGAGGELRQRTVELIGYATSVRLTPEQEKVKADALSAIPAPCGNRSSLAVRCCGCNLFRNITGLAKHMIAEERADGAARAPGGARLDRPHQPAGYSGAACDSKRCERPFHEDGCGGMNEARLVL